MNREADSESSRVPELLVQAQIKADLAFMRS
jgi:hypothetical protein